jgi:[protein-PII] uridylyltransferase
MTAAASVNPELRDLYARESAAIQLEFSETGDGRRALDRRTALVDSIVQSLWNEIIVPSAPKQPAATNGNASHNQHHNSDSLPPSSGPKNFALIATGGYGRGWLFPHSDIDLLFLHAGTDTENEFKDPIRRFSQELWDLRLKLSPATRTLAECERLDPNNLEFAISLLDCRYLAGDRDLFMRLREKSVPQLVSRECHALIQNLGELTRARHHKFGNTVFHLEPNVKDGPGGLRDYNVACWLALISAMEKLRRWPDAQTLLPVSSRRAFDAALDFQMSVRCFLHFRDGRDDNMLSWDAQEDASARKIGAADAEITNAADWMRVYFGHVRNVHRVCTQLLEEIPAAWSSLYRQFQGWRTKIASPDFSVVDGLIFLQQPTALQDPEKLLGLFHFLAKHGLKLSTTTEYKVEQALPSLASTPPRGGELWLYLQETLVQPHAADALRAMNALRLLTLLLPELKGIEALVVRDFYHRYTVDEHSFLAIEHLHRLKESKSEWDRRFAELLGELEQPELLYLSLLLHDSGKGVPSDNHVEASLDLTETCAQRLDLDAADRETVRYLVASHLDMSAAMRRDVFDPANVKTFAEKVGTPERLKMLCLMTYADIKAVNPDAMTPWKADNLWQLYIASANYLSRSADERVHTGTGHDTDAASPGLANLAHLRSLAPVAGKKINIFLEGMPQRYLRIHGATDVLAHAEMASRLGQDGVLCELKQVRHWYELTLITTDRPFLFASVSGALAAWGMNIVKANAFSNAAGTVVDTFYFTDRFRTLEMNIQEWDRLKKNIADVVKGQADVARMLRDRLKSEKTNGTKVKVATQIEFDDQSSAHSTLVQILTQDRPGLLYQMCSLISKHECNIEIALVETEGQMAIDIFYLTSAGAKLTPDRHATLGQLLRQELSGK